MGLIESPIHPHKHRFITIGQDAFSRVLVVVYTYRENVIRIISARRATTNELRTYQEG